PPTAAEPRPTATADTGPPRDTEHDPRLLRLLRRGIEPLTRSAIGRPKTVFLAAACALLIGLSAFLSLGREFMPPLDEGDIAMQALRVPSTSLTQSLTMQSALEKAIAAQPEVRTVFSRTGTAEVAVDPMPPNITDSIIMLKDRADWPDPTLGKEALIARIESTVNEQLGNAFVFSQPIEL